MKNITKYIVIALTFLFIFSPDVLASSEIKSREFIKIDGKQVKKYYNNTETGVTNHLGGKAGIVTIIIDGQEHIGFCIDFGMSVSTGVTENPQTLKEYFQNVLSEKEANELIRKLTLYMTFGYGAEGKKTDKYYLATQQLIWQAISDTGFYASDFYHNQTNGSVRKMRIDNFRWTNDEGKSTIDISEEINNIQNTINQYYKTPSFCSSQNKIEIEVGETAEFTDKNNVLQSYDIKCDNGITCETEGNKLKVTAIDEASSQRITFSKKSSGSENLVYKVTGKQGLITNEGTLEPVSCEFGIDSFKNVQTSDSKILYIITIGIFCGVMAYITYYTKKSLNEIK
ncbi:MAG: thioester domain-containing protein [Bacilli bacterium]|nr:thioester domain-containing protein [Bacilli bacterium]